MQQTPRAAYAPQAGIVQRLGEMPDRVTEKTRRRDAGERSSVQRVTATPKRDDPGGQAERHGHR